MSWGLRRGMLGGRCEEFPPQAACVYSAQQPYGWNGTGPLSGATDRTQTLVA